MKTPKINNTKGVLKAKRNHEESLSKLKKNDAVQIGVTSFEQYNNKWGTVHEFKGDPKV